MNLKQECKSVRKHVLKMAHESKSSHVGPSLSCVEILVALYYKVMTSHDAFILSKGHGCMAYYAVLAKKGFFDFEDLYSYGKNGGKLAEHPSCDTPGIDVHTGSLGHGLSIAVGKAIARKIRNIPGIEFVLLSDGECNEGSVWEAVSFAAQKKLNNLVVIVDKNNFQAIDKCENVNNIDLKKVFESFGWECSVVDGHNVDLLVNHIMYNTLEPFPITGKPTLILANTVKGKGVSFMENNLEWHYKYPNKEELEKALQEIENA